VPARKNVNQNQQLASEAENRDKRYMTLLLPQDYFITISFISFAFYAVKSTKSEHGLRSISRNKIGEGEGEGVGEGERRRPLGLEGESPEQVGDQGEGLGQRGTQVEREGGL
jgi:hypothetical protein